MSQDRELKEAFLQAAYDACTASDAGMERIDRIAETLDYEAVSLDPSTREYADRVEAAVKFLVNRGFLSYKSQGPGIGNFVSVTSEGMRKVENEDTHGHGNTTYNFNAPVQGSIVGNQGHAELTSNFNFSEVESQIEEEGGEDKEELREILAELKSMLDSKDSIPRGFLGRFSETLRKHQWFSGSVMTALLGFVTNLGS